MTRYQASERARLVPESPCGVFSDKHNWLGFKLTGLLEWLSGWQLAHLGIPNAPELEFHAPHALSNVLCWCYGASPDPKSATPKSLDSTVEWRTHHKIYCASAQYTPLLYAWIEQSISKVALLTKGGRELTCLAFGTQSTWRPISPQGAKLGMGWWSWAPLGLVVHILCCIC